MSIISIVYKKELKDIMRDKKTLIASILIPLLLYPIIFGFMGRGIKSNIETIKKDMKVAIVDKGNSKLGEFLKSNHDLKIQQSSNVSNDVKEGKLLLGIEIPENFDKNLLEGKRTQVTVIADNTSQKSSMAMGEIDKIIQSYSDSIVEARLKSKNIDPTILTPFEIVSKSAEKEDNGLAKMMLSLMLPMMIIVFSATGPIASATDLGAGEKERGTLEPLLTTQASRMSLLWGKLFAIATMGIITSVSFISGILISMKISPEAFNYGEGGIGFVLAPKFLYLMALISIMLTMFFGALALAISIYARSFKEAQTYLTPLTFIGMLGFSSYFIEPKNMSMIFLNIPIINAAAVLKELIIGVFNITHLGILILWMIVYLSISIGFARYMFNREDVIFRT